MSDFVLKFWPKEEQSEIKVTQIKEGLKTSQIIGLDSEFWGKPAYNAGDKINEYLEPKLDRSNQYFNTIKITIDEKDYGVRMGTEEFEYIDRNNVVSIKGGEGAFNKWDEMCRKLNEITGDEYEGDWEII